jgi:tetratricopeptide (TPR) repeat protein
MATAFLKIAVLLGLMVLAEFSAVCQQEKGLSIQGKVRTGDGTALPSDITVRLEKAEGVLVTQQFVGTGGKFEFTNLTGDLYRLDVAAKGFQTVKQDVDMHYLASRYPTIYLVPLGNKESVSSSSPSVNASDLAASKKARKEYEKGHAALQSGKYAEAREHLEKALAEDPCYSRAHAALGVALSMQHLFAPAESSLKKAIACDSGFLEAYIQLAILLNIEGKYVENEAHLQEGLRHFPSEWQLYYQLGIAERSVGQFDKAEDAYLKAQSINPAVPPEFHVKLADVLLRQKRYQKAYAEMQAYLRAAPNGSFAGETKTLMKRLESSGLVSISQDKDTRVTR